MKIDKKIFKIIVFVVIQAFAVMDFAWAAGGEVLDDFPFVKSETLAPALHINNSELQKVFRGNESSVTILLSRDLVLAPKFSLTSEQKKAFDFLKRWFDILQKIHSEQGKFEILYTNYKKENYKIHTFLCYAPELYRYIAAVEFKYKQYKGKGEEIKIIDQFISPSYKKMRIIALFQLFLFYFCQVSEVKYSSFLPERREIIKYLTDMKVLRKPGWLRRGYKIDQKQVKKIFEDEAKIRELFRGYFEDFTAVLPHLPENSDEGIFNGELIDQAI